jgi:hypothetical protein
MGLPGRQQAGDPFLQYHTDFTIKFLKLLAALKGPP